MIYAITTYPLSHTFHQQLEKIYGASINYLQLTELSSLSVLKILKKLRSIKAKNLLIPLEDINSESLLPILLIVTLFIKKQVIEVIYPNFQRKRISFWQMLKAVTGFIQSSISSYLLLWRSNQQMKKLLQAPRINFQPHNSNNVLYLNANLWFGIQAGGSVGHIAGVLNALNKNNYRVKYAATDKNSLISPNIAFELLLPPKTFGMPKELNHYRFNKQVVNQLIKALPNFSPKFIYQRMSLANYAGVLLSQHFQTPLILEYNGSEAWVAKNWGRPLRYHQQAVMAEDVCLKHAHLIVAISAVLRDELIDRGVNPERIVYYPNCIDPEIFNPQRFTQTELFDLRKTYNIAHDATVLTFVGTFGKWHGVDILARAIRYLVDHEEEWLAKYKVHWLLVGDGMKMAEVKNILSDEKYNRFVTLTGLVPQHEAPKYLAASDILLSPHVANTDGTRFFGSPTKLFEYMAMGKAIIASDLEQIGEVLKNSLRAPDLETQTLQEKNSQLAILCEPGNTIELVKAIQFLIKQPQWRSILGDSAREEALAKYTWIQHTDAFLKKLENYN